jgi:hypothetical protein
LTLDIFDLLILVGDMLPPRDPNDDDGDDEDEDPAIFGFQFRPSEHEIATGEIGFQGQCCDAESLSRRWQQRVKNRIAVQRPNVSFRQLRTSHHKGSRQLCAITRLMHCNKKSLLDHLVGCTEQHRRHDEAKRPGSFEINDQLKLGWKLYRQAARLGTLEDFDHVTGRTAIAIG